MAGLVYLLKSFQQDRHWSELIPSRDNVKTEKDNVVLPEMERKRREAVWELFKSEAVFLVDYLMVLKHVSLFEKMKTPER